MGRGPKIEAFFDAPTFTVSYLVYDTKTRAAAIIDAVLGFDPASGRTNTQSVDKIIAHIETNDLILEWTLETHAHADHLSAAQMLKARFGGKIAIGQGITNVQNVFGDVFNLGAGFARDGRQFDHLFADGEKAPLGELSIEVLATPGHTPGCVTYKIGENAFVGDTMFMPDYGTARADFPGGDARTLYRSIHKILSLPPQTTLYMCHDYKAPGRDEYAWKTSVAAQRANNVHVREGISEDEFVAMRTAKDKTLCMPKLILPAIQVNIRAGALPVAEDNGTAYMKLPINAL